MLLNSPAKNANNTHPRALAPIFPFCKFLFQICFITIFVSPVLELTAELRLLPEVTTFLHLWREPPQETVTGLLSWQASFSYFDHFLQLKIQKLVWPVFQSITEKYWGKSSKIFGKKQLQRFCDLSLCKIFSHSIIYKNGTLKHHDRCHNPCCKMQHRMTHDLAFKNTCYHGNSELRDLYWPLTLFWQPLYSPAGKHICNVLFSFCPLFFFLYRQVLGLSYELELLFLGKPDVS